MTEWAADHYSMREPITNKLFYPNQPSEKTKCNGLATTTDDTNGWRTRHIEKLASPIASINDTLCMIFSERTHEVCGHVLVSRFTDKNISDLLLADVIRARALRKIRDMHYAKIADMLLEE